MTMTNKETAAAMVEVIAKFIAKRAEWRDAYKSLNGFDEWFANQLGGSEYAESVTRVLSEKAAIAID